MRAMFQVNMQTQAENKFFGIQKDGKNWVAWYYKELVVRPVQGPNSTIGLEVKVESLSGQSTGL